MVDMSFSVTGVTLFCKKLNAFGEKNPVPCHNAVGYYPIKNDLIKTLFSICHIFCLFAIQPKNFYHFVNATKI